MKNSVGATAIIQKRLSVILYALSKNGAPKNMIALPSIPMMMKSPRVTRKIFFISLKLP